MKQPPKIHIVDDDPVILDSLRLLLESAGRACETFQSAAEFLDKCSPDARGCLLLDVRMPEIGGLQLHKLMNQRGYHMPVIYISGHANVPIAVEAMKIGAFDFLQKPFHSEDLLELVSQALELEEKRFHETKGALAIRARMDSLTSRERQVMDLMVIGLTSKEIARKLHISPRTIEIHRSNVMKKLQVKSLPQLARLASN